MLLRKRAAVKLMDKDNLNQLREAFAHSPDNTALLCVLLRGYLAADEPTAGLELLSERGHWSDDQLHERDRKSVV